MNLRYLFGAILVAPCLPILYYQGKKIKREVPSLPEAKNPEGMVDIGAEETLRLLTVGESTIAGVGVETHEEGFSGTLAKALAPLLGQNISWRVYARSGYTAKRSTYKLIPKIEESKVDLLVIGSGGNDAFNLNTPAGWRKDIRGLIHATRARFPDTPIVFINMPPIKTFPAFTRLIGFSIGNLVEIFGQELQQIVLEFPKVYFNSEIIRLEQYVQKLNLPPEAFFSDGVHPSRITYQTWAREMATFIAAIPDLSK